MTFPADFSDVVPLTEAHKIRARRFWTPTEHPYDPTSSSQSASGGHPGHAAVQDAPPSITALRGARKHLRRLGVSVAGPTAVVTPVPPIRVIQSGSCGYTAARVNEGPWGPTVWVVRDVLTRDEVARYPAAEVDGPGAILRFLQEQQCWQERQRGGDAA